MQKDSINKGQLLLLIQDYFSFLLEKIKVIFGFLVVGLIIGISYAILKKPTYEAKLVFMLNDSKSVNMGNLSALAGQLGLGGQSGLNVSEDRVFYLAYTKRIIGGALLSKNDQGVSLGDRLIAIRSLKAAWGKDSILNQFESFKAKEISQLSKPENKAIEQLIQIILLTKKYGVDSYKKKVSSLVGSQNSGMMYVSFEFTDELFSKDFVAAVYEELSNFYSIAAIKSLQNNYDLISSREDSLKLALQVIEDQMATTIDNNFQVNKFIGKVGENRLRRKLEILNLFYAEVIKNKEVAKFNLDSERPVFQIVDEPMLPLEAKYKSKAVYASLAGFGFLMMGIGLFTLVFMKQNGMLSKQFFRF
jgi:hypothetical protein